MLAQLLAAEAGKRAAEARASIPTPEAKQATWRALVDDASMPNETQVRVLRGLTNVERHPELLAPFVGAYVEAIDSVWSSRTFHMAENLLMHGFRRIVFLNGHGGNNAVLGTTAQDLLRTHPDIELAWVGVSALAKDAVARLGPRGEAVQR